MRPALRPAFARCCASVESNATQDKRRSAAGPTAAARLPASRLSTVSCRQPSGRGVTWRLAMVTSQPSVTRRRAAASPICPVPPKITALGISFLSARTARENPNISSHRPQLPVGTGFRQWLLRQYLRCLSGAAKRHAIAARDGPRRTKIRIISSLRNYEGDAPVPRRKLRRPPWSITIKSTGTRPCNGRPRSFFSANHNCVLTVSKHSQSRFSTLCGCSNPVTRPRRCSASRRASSHRVLHSSMIWPR